MLATLRSRKALAISEAPTIEVTLESGERLELNPGRARTILQELSSALDRSRASRAWLEALGRQSQTYAALLEGIVKKAGAWYTYDSERLGQGREASKLFLREHLELRDEIEAKVRAALGLEDVIPITDKAQKAEK